MVFCLGAVEFFIIFFVLALSYEIPSHTMVGIVPLTLC